MQSEEFPSHYVVQALFALISSAWWIVLFKENMLSEQNRHPGMYAVASLWCSDEKFVAFNVKFRSNQAEFGLYSVAVPDSRRLDREIFQRWYFACYPFGIHSVVSYTLSFPLSRSGFCRGLPVFGSFATLLSVQICTWDISSSFICVSLALPMGRFSSNFVFSSLAVRGLDVALAVWCFTLTRWTTSKPSSDNRKPHCASLLGASNRFCIHITESSSVRIVTHVPFEEWS